MTDEFRIKPSPTRNWKAWRVLNAISERYSEEPENPMYLSEIAREVCLPRGVVLYHCRRLEEANLIMSFQYGTNTYYTMPEAQ